MNWLANPTRKADGFRPQDWIQELINFRHKVLHAGSSSNHTLELIKLIIKRSPLIGIFGEVHDIVERMLHVNPGTVSHTRPDMTQTLQMLAAEMEKRKAHKFVKG
jgi:predicted phosphodiesterase